MSSSVEIFFLIKHHLGLLIIFIVYFPLQNKRKAPIDELLNTEDKYLENLIMVRDVFR